MFGDLFAYLPIKVIQVCTARLQGADPVPLLDLGDGAAGDVVVHVHLYLPLRNEFLGSLVHNFLECLLILDGARGVRVLVMSALIFVINDRWSELSPDSTF